MESIIALASNVAQGFRALATHLNHPMISSDLEDLAQACEGLAEAVKALEGIPTSPTASVSTTSSEETP